MPDHLRRLPNALTLLTIALLAVNYFSPCADLDFAWQIRTGELIVESGTLRPPESFTYTIAGTHVPEFEWLYDVLLYGVWTAFGHGGLKLLRTLLVVTPLLLLAWQLRRGGVRWHGIALSLLAAAVIVSPTWNLRPMYCTTIGLLLVVGCLHDHCTGRKPLPWWLPLVFLLWANLHPAVILGQAILIGAIGWEWVNARVRLNDPLGRAALWRLTVVGGVSLAATLVGPDPIDRLLYPFRPELSHPIQRVFAEMRPLYSLFGEAPVAVGGAYLVALLVGLTVILRFRRYRLWEVATLVGLAGLANLASRSLRDWVLVSLALGVPHLVVMIRQAAARRRSSWSTNLLRVERSAKRLLGSPLFRPQPRWLLAALAAVTLVSLTPALGRDMPVRESRNWPRASVDRAEQFGLKGRFFGPPDYGSYLTWRLPGRALTYTDTRGFYFPPHLLEDSHFVPQLGPDWRRRLDRVLDEYRTDFFLLETAGPRGELWRQLRPVLESEPLHCDDVSVLLTAAQVRAGLAHLDALAGSR